ncbi:HNH endonuclease, partial [Paenarthrobacter aurescens]|nr:HNH endonuclease [Paenarthrobacter aurescens]MDO6158860.1 HNH endonuclease [Paenarthrobacter aurescens]MDO6162844.1 HNH endonuclease [Paenarthrobacter aurescens]
MKQIREGQAQTAASAAPVLSNPRGPSQLRTMPTGTVSGDLVEQLRVLEEMKSAITALQARVAVA